MRNIFPLARLAEAVAFDRFGENDRWLALMFGRRLIGRIDLAHVVAAAQQLADLLVAQMVHQLEQLRVFAKEMLARVAARLDDIFLVVAVHAFLHALEQPAGLIARQQLVPVRAPDDLDDVPTCAPEKSLQFLDDFSVAAHRAVEPLQIAVHHPDQIVEVLARREGDGPERFRLVAFAVAEERPDFGFRLPVRQPARLQVAVEPRLIQRHDRAETHRDRRELPEIRHQIWMRIRRQAAAGGQFLPEIQQMIFIQPALQKRPRINAGRRVALEIDLVAGKILRAPAEEMVEPHFVKRRR